MKDVLAYVSFFLSSLLFIELLVWKLLIFKKVVLIRCLGDGNDNLALRAVERCEFSIGHFSIYTARLLFFVGILWATNTFWID